MLIRQLITKSLLTGNNSCLFNCLCKSVRPFCLVKDNYELVSILKTPRYFDLAQSRCDPNSWLQVNSLLDELNDLKDLADSGDDGLVKDIKIEEKRILDQLKRFESVIINGLIGDDDSSVNKAILEIGNGVGGQEAMLFASEMFNVYKVYCQFKGWKSEVLEEKESPLGGLHEASIQIEGDYCFKFLRHEAGVHRVQRVPKTEKSGRIHTSTVTVTVLPITEETKIDEIPAKDIKMQFVRSSGPGGQHVNKTDSCVKIFHLPTGIQVECQESRVQSQNKKKAMEKLANLLFLRNKERILTQYASTRQTQVASADRSEKIRTYNFNQDRITDHRLNQNYHEIREFIKGQPERLQEIIDALELRHRKILLSQLTSEIN